MRFCYRSELSAVLFGIFATVLAGDIVGLSPTNANAQELARAPEAPDAVADVGPARVAINWHNRERLFAAVLELQLGYSSTRSDPRGANYPWSKP
jgi:hypothetical protein